MGMLNNGGTAVLTISACTPEAAAVMRTSQDLALHGNDGFEASTTPGAPREASRSAYAVGDELLCFFESADSGFHSAHAYRQLVHEHSRIPIAFHIRMLLDCPGITDATLGYAVRRKIVTTRKLVRRLPADRIFATAAGVQQLSEDVRSNFRPAEQTLFGTFPGEQLYCAATHEETCTRLSISTRNEDSTTPDKMLHLRWRDHKLTVRPESPPITFGRSGEADIQLESDLTSRIHAQLSFQLTDFILADQSTNGTYVKMDDAEEVPLHHEQIVLRRTGVISLGARIQLGRGNLIYFSIG
ncbi:MAG: FHA domain-containing protein, partial [Thiogranum sp.]|jgi:hypothetical protein